MAKKSLKNALRAHTARKLEAVKASKVAEAAQRKIASVKAGISQNGRAGKQKQRKADRAEASPSKHDASTKDGTRTPSQPETPRRRRNRIIPFDRDDTILLVGEGNFSFAHSLLVPPHSFPPSRILATAFDTEEQCYGKYPDAKEHVDEIRRLAGREDVVLFGVDAGELASHKGVRSASTSMNARGALASWSKIVFNFPHVGAGHKDERRNVLANQVLLLRFLISAAALLSIGGTPSWVQNVSRGPPEKAARTNANLVNAEYVGQEEAYDGFDYEPDANDDTDVVGLETVEGVTEGGAAVEAPSAAAVPRSEYATPRAPSRAGSILLTLRNSKPYTLWDVPTLAKRMSNVWHTIAQEAPALARGQRMPTADGVNEVLRLGHGGAYRVWRSFVFEPHDWHGYGHRRTIGWREGVSSANNEDLTRETAEQGECRTWQLGLVG